MFANPSTKHNHAGLSRFPGHFIEITNVLYDINDKARLSKGVEVDHVSNRTVGEGRTEYRYIVLKVASDLGE